MVLQYAKQNGLPMKWDASDGTLRIWEPRSRAFAAYNRNGTTKTFFRPNNESYWGRQPGEPIRASGLPF
jgi:pyocin large subunit-like protein